MTAPLTGELGLIAALAARFGTPPPEVLLGIGDDCAAIALEDGQVLLWTVDTLMEGVHFDLSYVSLHQLGRKSLAVNLSDIAAMGGEPRYALLSLGWPRERELNGALEVGEGLAQAAREYGVAVIGGDTVASQAGLAVTVAVLGWVPAEEMVQRAGAQVGDQIYVTGPLGEAAAGLEILRRQLKVEPSLSTPLVQAHLDPWPQLEVGRLLARQRLATALIDLSDGVASDLLHVCRASGVGARLEADNLPISEGVAVVARMLHREPVDLALKGGEDYQLLFTCPPADTDRLRAAFSQAYLPLPVLLGEIVSGGEVLLAWPDGVKNISGGGYDHFP